MSPNNLPRRPHAPIPVGVECKQQRSKRRLTVRVDCCQRSTQAIGQLRDARELGVLVGRRHALETETYRRDVVVLRTCNACVIVKYAPRRAIDSIVSRTRATS